MLLYQGMFWNNADHALLVIVFSFQRQLRTARRRIPQLQRRHLVPGGASAGKTDGSLPTSGSSNALGCRIYLGSSVITELYKRSCDRDPDGAEANLRTCTCTSMCGVHATMSMPTPTTPSLCLCLCLHVCSCTCACTSYSLCVCIGIGINRYRYRSSYRHRYRYIYRYMYVRVSVV